MSHNNTLMRPRDSTLPVDIGIGTVGGRRDSSDPSIPSSSYMRMASKWALIDALKGGTDAMRAAGQRYLPKEPKEEIAQYNVRIARSFLYGAFSATADTLSSKPFSKPVTLTDEDSLPEQLQEISKDVNRTGQDLHSFAEEFLDSAISNGVSHALVDYPTISRDANLQQERDLGARPLFIHIPATSMLGWRYRTDSTGARVLTSIRFIEHRLEEVGKFGEKEVAYIRVYTETDWSTYRKDKDSKKWVLYEKGTHTFGRVPLVTFYTERTGFMTADPPLSDLAELNLQHWQNQSDYHNALRFASIGILVAAGFTDEEIGNGIVVAPNVIVSSENKDANLKYTEQKGIAIGAARTNLQDIEAKMEVLGHAPLIERTQKSTAQAKASNDDRSHSNIQSWIRLEESALHHCYALAAEWVNGEISDDFSIAIYSDFGVKLRNKDDTKTLQTARAARDITQKTLLIEFQRRGILREGLDVEAEIEETKTEAIEGVMPEPEEEDNE